MRIRIYYDTIKQLEEQIKGSIQWFIIRTKRWEKYEQSRE